jgi:hypothetical protein
MWELMKKMTQLCGKNGKSKRFLPFLTKTN